MRTPARFLVPLVLVVGLTLSPKGSAQSPEPVRVGILVYEGVYNTEFIAPLDVFQHAAEHTGGRLQVFTVAPSLGSATTAEGLRILPDYSFLTAPEIDWLVVPSGKNYRTDIGGEALVSWIRRTGGKAKIVHSNCWGAFLLAAAGLLDGKRATTYPASYDEFAARFPRVELRRGPRFVDSNGTVTSAGGVSSYEAALYLIEKHFDPELARKIAAGLVIDWDLARVPHEVVSGSASE